MKYGQAASALPASTRSSRSTTLVADAIRPINNARRCTYSSSIIISYCSRYYQIESNLTCRHELFSKAASQACDTPTLRASFITAFY